MRSEEYSEWDEYIGLASMKRVVENAISRISALNDYCDKIKKGSLERNELDYLKTCIEHLDVSRVSLIALLNELDHCSMVGTQIKNGNQTAKKEEK